MYKDNKCLTMKYEINIKIRLKMSHQKWTRKIVFFSLLSPNIKILSTLIFKDIIYRIKHRSKIQ